MRILEILLPKTIRDRDLSSHSAKEIDTLQKRMDQYVDKIMDPKTSAAGKEFLKSRLRDDYYELKDTIKGIHLVAEDDINDTPIRQYEVFDRKTGAKVPGRGPYGSASRARRAVDQLDNAYGAYRYSYRPVATLKESVNKVPLTNEDFDLVKELMNRPIPAAIATIYLHEVIDDDEFTDQIKSLEETKPNMDIRPLLVEWFKRVMPDQMYRFTDDHKTKSQTEGILSPIHGYNENSFKSAKK